ncbi:MAG: porin family protein [Mucinivorans sp.]
MKRITTLCLVLVLGVTTALAQDFYFAPKAGLNFSSITKTSYSRARVMGFVGVVAGYQINDIVGVAAEAQYSWQGYKLKNETDARVALDYIKIPLTVKLFIVKGLNVEAGVSFNFLTSAKAKYNTVIAGGDGAGREVKTNLMDECKKFDFTIPVGINYLFFKKLEVGLRYEISTVRIPQNTVDKAKNSNWQVSLSYRF